MAVEHSHFELAQRWAEASDGSLSTQEVLGVWERYPAWAPGGKHYAEYGLPSSLEPRTVEVDRELDWFWGWLSFWTLGILPL